MNRRNFCLTVAAALTQSLPAGTVSALERQASDGDSNEADFSALRHLATDLFRDVDAAKDIGRFILATHPEQRDIRQLMENAGFATGISHEEFIHNFTARVKADFANSNTLFLKGWIMSISEASVCSLLALA